MEGGTWTKVEDDRERCDTCFAPMEDGVCTWNSEHPQKRKLDSAYRFSQTKIEDYKPEDPIPAEVMRPLAPFLNRMFDNEKPSNPKDSMGIKKVPFSAIPSEVIAELGIAMMEGALKYGRHNYRVVGVRASVYYDAFLRHVTAWWEGEDIDPVSGEHHLIKAMACITVVKDSINRGNWVDDRPPKLSDGWQEPLNEKAAKLIEKFPEPKQAYTEK
jgi:hypothetical protein